MKKILIFIGTRPEAIKLAPVVSALRKRKALNTRVCLSSQHKEMLEQALRWLPIDIDENLQVMRQAQGLSDTFAAILASGREVIERFLPDWIIVQGDTTTATAAALAGFYAKVNIAHVEAGLRSGNNYSPYPEEMNRQLISRLAKLHFAPTLHNANNLAAEKTSGKTHVVGNTVIDALLQTRQKIEQDKNAQARIRQSLAADGYAQDNRPYILVTGHRRENFGDGLRNICAALLQIANAHPHIDIVYAIHLNPQACEAARKILARQKNIYLIPPQDYAVFVFLMNGCHFIMTDSGGIQEEAPSLNKPVLVMRDDTERPEVIECGAAKLVGVAVADIVIAAQELLTQDKTFARMAAANNPYGDGQSAQRIADIFVAL